MYEAECTVDWPSPIKKKLPRLTTGNILSHLKFHNCAVFTRHQLVKNIYEKK